MRKIVNGSGNLNASLLIIGEAPGATEEEMGIPFVGKAGKLLIKTLFPVSREEVYITNVIKYRPPNNRTPTKLEIEKYLPLLFEEIKLIRPEVVLCLGSVASKIFMGESVNLSKDRGIFIPTTQGFRVMPTFHPAYICRNPSKLEIFSRDIKYAVEESNERRKRREKNIAYRSETY